MKRLLLFIVLPAVVLFGLIQLVPASRTNPAVRADLQAPPAIKALLKTSCYDCHSNETTWPWYSKVAPVSWLVVHDVNEGRSELNFSEWGTYNTFKKRHLLKEMKETIEEGTMPVKLYTYTHSKAKLDDKSKAQLVRWITESMKKLPKTLKGSKPKTR
ncbi:MAG: heme-binding protein [Deltaproteobacteria bacterium]|nr:MAG: heme-binding protein [Deltaproteobacteria bacterium]